MGRHSLVVRSIFMKSVLDCRNVNENWRVVVVAKGDGIASWKTGERFSLSLGHGHRAGKCHPVVVRDGPVGKLQRRVLEHIGREPYRYLVSDHNALTVRTHFGEQVGE